MPSASTASTIGDPGAIAWSAEASSACVQPRALDATGSARRAKVRSQPRTVPGGRRSWAAIVRCPCSLAFATRAADDLRAIAPARDRPRGQQHMSLLAASTACPSRSDRARPVKQAHRALTREALWRQRLLANRDNTAVRPPDRPPPPTPPRSSPTRSHRTSINTPTQARTPSRDGQGRLVVGGVQTPPAPVNDDTVMVSTAILDGAQGATRARKLRTTRRVGRSSPRR